CGEGCVECGAGSPYCINTGLIYECVECNTDAQCNGGDGEWCNANTCETCNTLTYCGSLCTDCTLTNGVCNTDGSGCVDCNSDTDCSGGLICDTGTNTCIGNVLDTSVRVSAGTDDAEEQVGGDVQLGSSDLELVEDPTAQTVGVRFASVDVPPGSVITNAYLEFAADEINSEPTTLFITAEAADNAGTFTSSNGDISSRATVSSTVTWADVEAWTTVGQLYESPDLSGLVQDVVDRAGWAEGNAIAFIISGSGKRVAFSYGGSPSLAPLLHVEFYPGEVTNQAPEVNAGADEAIILPQDTVNLDGTVTDDGLPEASVMTTAWNVLSGPGAVTFGDETAVDTTATFVVSGNYTLELSADDGELSASDTVEIAVIPEGTGVVVVESMVSSSADDVEEQVGGGMALASSDLELVQDGLDQVVGLRFADLDIPQGAIITNAYLVFVADETQSVETSLVLTAENVDNALSFTDDDYNVTSRTTLATTVSWDNIEPWNAVGETHQSVDISILVQEIVDRSGWVEGNALAVIISGVGTRVAESYEANPALAPLIHVEYLTP
ncbi:MAG: hypothetical protein GY847_35805, partial [Proteobacteria bacterium]|nr:hypothetical protein [Pseudomonadota bacterium]